MTKKRHLRIQEKSEEQQSPPKMKKFRSDKVVRKLKKKVSSHGTISEDGIDAASIKKPKKSADNSFVETAKDISDLKNGKAKKIKRKRLHEVKSNGDSAVSTDQRLVEAIDTREIMKTLEITNEQSDEHLEETKPEISEEVENLKPIPPTVTDEDKLNAIKSIRKQADQALNILRQFAERSMSKSLFPEVDQVMHIQCVYKKPASANNTPIWNKRIVLPHPLHNPENTTVCLIMADIDRSAKARFDPDVDKQSRQWEDILREAYGITRIHVHKILTKRQLEREYRTFFEKRQLASAYDIFLVDSRVATKVWHECGKEFHKARKMPFSVDVSKKSLIEQIKRTYSMITLPLSPNRTRVSLIIGNLSQPHDHLLDNIQEAVARLFDFCPGGLINVRSLYLQIVTGGPTIPIYADIGSANAVRLPFPKKRKDRPEYQETIGELSTLPEGLEVAVRADGKIRVIDSETKKSVYYPTINDEWEQGDDLKPRIDPAKIEAKRAKRLAKKKRKIKLMEKRRAQAEESFEDGIEGGGEKKKKKKKQQEFDAISKALLLPEEGKRITTNDSYPSEIRKTHHKKHLKHLSVKLMKRRQKHNFIKKSKIST